MKAIHGGKAKNDKIDSHKSAVLLRGGMIPMAYVYPPERRATRDLLRRRGPLLRKRAEVLAHMQNTTRQYHLPEMGKKVADNANREGVAAHFPEPSVRKTLEMELALIDHYDQLRGAGELSLTRPAKGHAVQTFARVPSVPGIGQILALVIRYEMHDSARFPRGQDFVSYCRLVTCAKESAGKRHGRAGKKIGHPQLTWACSAAAVLCLRQNQPGPD